MGDGTSRIMNPQKSRSWLWCRHSFVALRHGHVMLALSNQLLDPAWPLAMTENYRKLVGCRITAQIHQISHRLFKMGALPGLDWPSLIKIVSEGDPDVGNPP